MMVKIQAMHAIMKIIPILFIDMSVKENMF